MSGRLDEDLGDYRATDTAWGPVRHHGMDVGQLVVIADRSG